MANVQSLWGGWDKTEFRKVQKQAERGVRMQTNVGAKEILSL